jgi:hypothetical protein
MALGRESTVPRTVHRSAPSLGEHKLLIAMAVAALAYCLGAPVLANLVAHFGS